MRNLHLLTSHHVSISALDEGVKSIQAISVDYDTGYIYCVTGTRVVLLDPNLSSVIQSVCLTDGDENFLPADGTGLVVGAQHLANQQSLCVATATGDIVLWSHILQQTECVGSVQDGLQTMQWSPDQEIVAFITGKDNLLLMTREFEPIIETPVNQAGFGEAVFVNVGWGKKETQFHGSEGKTAAKETPKLVNPAPLWDDHAPRLSWRGDGQYFVVSSYCPVSGCREMRAWSREGVLQSTCEQTDGLEQALAWKSTGSCIAAGQQGPNKHSIIFYEKNGLRHREFALPVDVDKVKICEVMWNLDSTILTVWCEDLPQESDAGDFVPQSYIQLWTTGNYHWYLKQSLQFKATDREKVVSVLWDPEHAYRLHIITASGEYIQYTWSWATDQSQGESCDDEATVAVIDGENVLITPFRRMVVPPPLSAYQLQLPCAANQVLFAPPPFTNDMAVVLVDGRIAVYKFTAGDNKVDESVKTSAAGGPGFSVCCDMLKLEQIYRIEDLPEDMAVYPLSLHHFSWVMPHCLLFSGSTKSGMPMLYQAEFKPRQQNRLIFTSGIEVEGHVFTTATSPFGPTVAVQLTDGSLLKYESVTNTLLPWETPSGEEVRFPQPCTQIQISEVGEEDVVLGLTNTFRFYVNNVEIASNCTSFAVDENFLLLTTLTHTCRCISRNTPVHGLSRLSDEKSHPFDESVRRVERGSRIVTVVPGDTKLILQMPRGNLETIHPRALVLTAVRTALDRLEYRKAFKLMKKHRINLNLMYDHNPQMFLSNISRVLSQISTVNYINIFLTELQEEDTTLTMYTTEDTSRPERVLADNAGDRPSKVDIVCDAIRGALEAMGKNKYLLSILTTYVKKRSPELEEALKLISALKGQEGDVVGAEEALKYLLFLVDVNQLYDVALGSYDFDLVLMVAEKSQKDPKEYLPFLSSLRKLEENYQKYSIDRHLKRYQRALQHISLCPDHFNECLKLVSEQKLYGEALHIFNRQTHQYKTIAGMFGEHLMEKKKYQEAGLVFMKAESWSQALQAFEKCLNWRQALCMAAMLDYSAEDLHDLSLRLAKSLQAKQEMESAALLYEQYVGDIEEAIIVLIEGQLWEESLRLMHKYKRTDFIETNLKPSLCERHSQQVSTLDSLKSDFERHKQRLKVVREAKERSHLEYLEGEGQTDTDLFSDASSAAGESVQSSRLTTDSQRSTIISRSTGRSSRNRRKLERKKWSLKEGSEHEDLALLEALSNIVTVVNNLRGEITQLLRMLVQFWQESEAKEIQQKYENLLNVIERSIPEIWSPEADDSDNKPVIGPDATANQIAAAMQSGQKLKSTNDSESMVKAKPVFIKDSKWKLGILET